MVVFKIKSVKKCQCNRYRSDDNHYDIDVEVPGTSWIMGMGPTNQLSVRHVSEREIKDPKKLRKRFEDTYLEDLASSRRITSAKAFMESFTGRQI